MFRIGKPIKTENTLVSGCQRLVGGKNRNGLLMGRRFLYGVMKCSGIRSW